MKVNNMKAKPKIDRAQQIVEYLRKKGRATFKEIVSDLKINHGYAYILLNYKIKGIKREWDKGKFVYFLDRIEQRLGGIKMELKKAILEDMKIFFNKYTLTMLFFPEEPEAIINIWKKIEAKFPKFVSYNYLQSAVSDFSKLGLLDVQKKGSAVLVKITEKGKEFRSKLIDLYENYLYSKEFIEELERLEQEETE